VRRDPDHLRCFTLHAERLEVDPVWARTDHLLRRLERRGGRATLFVHPFSAIEAGADLGPRIRSLIDRGHEIGQHTHYYAPRSPGSTGKPDSEMDADNVLRCLNRDLDYLRASGADPRGYVAGGWAMHDAADGWLRERAFSYDASVRSFSLGYQNPQAAAGDHWERPLTENGLVRLPTTTPATRWFRRANGALSFGAGSYDLAYIHDYDLLRLRARVAAMSVVASWRSGPWMTAAEIARLVASEPLSTA
jgi:peptidoglycan/xylan/chitin deacetylase (PgdA/CDA1 family)